MEQPARMSREALLVDESQTLKIGTVCGRGVAGRMKKIASNTNEVQTIAITGTLSGGFWQIKGTDKNGVERITANIAHNASVANIQTALDDAFGSSMIVAGGTAITATTLTFSGAGYAGKSWPIVELDTDGLTGEEDSSVTRTTQGGQSAGAGADEVQTMAITGTLTAGTFTLTFTKKDGTKGTTIALAYNADNTAIQNAVNTVLGSGACTVGGTAITANTFTFAGAGYTQINQPMIVIDVTLLEGCTGASMVETTQGGPPGDGFPSAVCLQELTTAASEKTIRATFAVRNCQVNVNMLDIPSGAVLADIVTALEKAGIQCLRQPLNTESL